MDRIAGKNGGQRPHQESRIRGTAEEANAGQMEHQGENGRVAAQCIDRHHQQGDNKEADFASGECSARNAQHQ